jgi:hypothetical protein
VRLQDLNAGLTTDADVAVPRPAEPLDPTIFDLPAPDLPIQPRDQRAPVDETG